jgi:putative ABC transport system substrate-binding protein
MRDAGPLHPLLQAGQLGAIQSVALSLGVELSPINVGDAAAFERAVAAFARSTNGGLIVTASPWALAHRDLIIALAAQHRLPAVYAWRYFVTIGGLISYARSSIDPFRRAAGYLPGQAPLVINLKTAEALSLDVPPSLLACADEVIE